MLELAVLEDSSPIEILFVLLLWRQQGQQNKYSQALLRKNYLGILKILKYM